MILTLPAFRAGALLVLLLPGMARAELFRVATFNVENYLDEPTRSRSAKSAEAKSAVRDSILALKPDAIALEEMGNLSALQELQQSIKAKGLDLPFWEHVTGADTNVHVAILSKFPFIARRSRTNDNFLLAGRRYRVSRGFGEVDIQVNSNQVFTLIAAHLKSKRPVPQADEADLRLEEAKLLREEIDARFAANPNSKLIVVGDFNDTRDSGTVRTVIGRGRHKLIDTSPSEREVDSSAVSLSLSNETRRITWTHYYPKEDTYSRIDYILLSPAIARGWKKEESFVLRSPDWGIASDHRPVMITFELDGN